MENLNEPKNQPEINPVGWSWEGEPFQAAVFLNNENYKITRTCFPAIRHTEGDIIKIGDSVLLKASETENVLPYVAKIHHLWKKPKTAEKMISIQWYYRPEHTDKGRQPEDSENEVFASNHRDHEPVACIEEKCYVLTLNQYRRYLLTSEPSGKHLAPGPTLSKIPANCRPGQIMFCQRIYMYTEKRFMLEPELKNLIQEKSERDRVSFLRAIQNIQHASQMIKPLKRLNGTGFHF